MALYGGSSISVKALRNLFVLPDFRVAFNNILQKSWTSETTEMNSDRHKPEDEDHPSTSGVGLPKESDIPGMVSQETHHYPFSFDILRQFFAEKLGIHEEFEEEDEDEEKVIEDLTFDGLMKCWKETGFKKIITMAGAGISTSAGIPDFRSPGSGLYHNLEKYNLPHPTAIFEMSYFCDNPKPFFVLAKELYPGSFKPTPCHYFIRLLHEKGLLVRHYTQNIDTLERIAGIPEDKIVEAHGTFFTNHCLDCRKEFSMEWMKEQIFNDVLPTCDVCNCVVKPDIVFFGENLPDKFYQLPRNDFKDCDLLIILGTSLEVQPFASLVNRADRKCLRLLINREKVGNRHMLSQLFLFNRGLSYDLADNRRDIAWIGDCDDGVFAIADAIGLGDDLRNLIKTEYAKLDAGIRD